MPRREYPGGFVRYSGMDTNASESPEQLKWNALTAREHEVALMLARGDTNREIANAMGISIKTVDTHRGHVLKKLELKNNVKLALFCLRLGVSS